MNVSFFFWTSFEKTNMNNIINPPLDTFNVESKDVVDMNQKIWDPLDEGVVGPVNVGTLYSPVDVAPAALWSVADPLDPIPTPGTRTGLDTTAASLSANPFSAPPAGTPATGTQTSFSTSVTRPNIPSTSFPGSRTWSALDSHRSQSGLSDTNVQDTSTTSNFGRQNTSTASIAISPFSTENTGNLTSSFESSRGNSASSEIYPSNVPQKNDADILAGIQGMQTQMRNLENSISDVKTYIETIMNQREDGRGGEEREEGGDGDPDESEEGGDGDPDESEESEESEESDKCKDYKMSMSDRVNLLLKDTQLVGRGPMGLTVEDLKRLLKTTDVPLPKPPRRDSLVETLVEYKSKVKKYLKDNPKFQ